MDTEKRDGNGNGWGQAAAGMKGDCLSGLMFCYNMPEPAFDDCSEAQAWAEDQANAGALMRYYNE